MELLFPGLITVLDMPQSAERSGSMSLREWKPPQVPVPNVITSHLWWVLETAIGRPLRKFTEPPYRAQPSRHPGMIAKKGVQPGGISRYLFLKTNLYTLCHETKSFDQPTLIKPTYKWFWNWTHTCQQVSNHKYESNTHQSAKYYSWVIIWHHLTNQSWLVQWLTIYSWLIIRQILFMVNQPL